MKEIKIEKFKQSEIDRR